MFEHLREYSRILVTGPHRSGTTIAATMIAHDTGHDLVKEEEFFYTRPEAFECLYDADYGPKVMQCPFMACRIHYYPEALVVWMNRPDQEIYDSISRMTTITDRKIMFHGWFVKEFDAYHTDEEDILKIKRENWELQKERLPHYIEIDYHTLSEHPLWIPKEKRNWHLRATNHGVV